MATAKVEAKTFENPLIPHARLRQIYGAMLRARMLEKALPAGRRGRSVGASGRGHAVGMVGLEACLVSPAVDLGPGDLVSDAVAGGVVDFLRGVGLGVVLGAAPRTKGRAAKKSFAECGAAGRLLPGGVGIAERLWVAMGAAAGLKAGAVRAKDGRAALVPTHRDTAGMDGAPGVPRPADGQEAKAAQAGVAVVYVRPGEATAGVWRKALEFAAKQELPMVFVVMPPVRGARPGGVSGLALRGGVPGIAVDADDAVAIYRVAQESIGRVRAGGGPALIECVPFVVHGTKARADAVGGLERYMLQRGVATKARMEGEGRRFAGMMRKG